MSIKIVFFDMDGTLVDYGRPLPYESTLQALQALQKRGVRIVVSTGRPLYAVPEFPGIEWDAAITFNGALTEADGQVISENPLDPDDVKTLYAWCLENRKPAVFAGRSEMKAPFFDPTLEEYMNIANQHCDVIEPDRSFESFIEQPIYQCMIAIPTAEKEKVLAHLDRANMVGWYPTSSDIVPLKSSKGEGVKRALEHFGLSRNEAMAFGDGDNDLEMLCEVGLPVAMGNATEPVKKAASYITKSVKEDGIAFALRHFGVLE